MAFLRTTTDYNGKLAQPCLPQKQSMKQTTNRNLMRISAWNTMLRKELDLAYCNTYERMTATEMRTGNEGLPNIAEL